jgi:uncharacterized protein YbbC (DUF1343 family)
MRILEMFGLPGIRNLNQYFKNYKNQHFQIISLIAKSNVSPKIPYCPIVLGTNFLDQILILEELNEIKFNNVAYPLIFLPFVSRASEIIGKKIHLKLDENNFLLCFNNYIYSNNSISNIIDNCKNLDIKFIENQDSFTENEWNELYQLSENTFLEETDSLKQTAAGAGLSDND